MKNAKITFSEFSLTNIANKSVENIRLKKYDDAFKKVAEDLVSKYNGEGGSLDAFSFLLIIGFILIVIIVAATTKSSGGSSSKPY